MFTFFERKTEVLNHWIAYADRLQASPNEFYAALEKELADRKVPSMQFSRIEFAEGGLLSEKRIYLRMLRERLVFDVCAAPFGDGFFFSCRTSEIPLVLNWFQLLAVLLLGLFFLWAFANYVGLILGPLLLLALVGAGVYVMRNAVSMGLGDLDKTLQHSRLLGSIYEVWFRKETYHRLDSRICYLVLVPSLVRKLAEEVSAAKGVQLVRQYELAPVLGELYHPAAPALPPPS
jgi:hypothetical protein